MAPTDRRIRARVLFLFLILFGALTAWLIGGPRSRFTGSFFIFYQKTRSHLSAVISLFFPYNFYCIFQPPATEKITKYWLKNSIEIVLE